MSDEIDMACEREQMDREISLMEARRAAAEIPPGSPGECDMCGSYFSRLVGGACGFCRDKYRLD